MLRPTAVKVTASDDYNLILQFDNGEIKKFDVKPYIKGDFYGQLSEPEYFQSVKTDGFTVVWPNGQDICPDELYSLSITE